MGSDLYSAFVEELLSCLRNNFSDNYDYHRSGRLPIKKRIKELVKSVLDSKGFYRIDSKMFDFSRNLKMDDFNYLYRNLNNAESRSLLVKIILYRLLGPRKVKLPSSDMLLQQMNQAYSFADPRNVIPLRFMNWKLSLCDLRKIGYPITLYCRPPAIAVQFMLRQYAYEAVGVAVKPEPHDVILDCGACFGDTALFFANETGPDGKIYSFEFIKDNAEIFKKNATINPDLAKRISLVEHPLWAESGLSLFYSDNGPASEVRFESFPGGAYSDPNRPPITI